ncbi:MAG: PhzF family phenazine biosynthesis protein, partial [Myxococcales bacterium]
GGGTPRTRASGLTAAAAAGLVGLDEADIAGEATWIDTGSEQLLVPVRSAAAVRRARPDASALAGWPTNDRGNRMLYLFALTEPSSGDRAGAVEARFFFDAGLGLAEDPGTGSACANLGGWLRVTGHALPARHAVAQGEATGRPCHLTLAVDAGRVQVGGRVVPIGRGEVTI